MTIQELAEKIVCRTLKKIVRLSCSVTLYLWQLPQNLLGLVLLYIYGPHIVMVSDDAGTRVYKSARMPGGISLGRYVIINKYQCTQQTIAHELGHARQSRFLGPLYLLVVGLPSILWAGLHGYVAPRKSYYWFYTERWADRLGGVRR